MVGESKKWKVDGPADDRPLPVTSVVDDILKLHGIYLLEQLYESWSLFVIASLRRMMR
jgi:hypothetical protein